MDHNYPYFSAELERPVGNAARIYRDIPICFFRQDNLRPQSQCRQRRRYPARAAADNPSNIPLKRWLLEKPLRPESWR